MNSINKIFLAVLLVFFATYTVTAQDASVKKGDILTLEQCINIAINNNPNIDFVTNTTKIYESRIGQAKSNYFPQLNLSSGYSRNNPVTNFTNDINANQYSGNVTLNQMVFDFGKTPTRVKIQDLNLTSSKLDIDSVIVQIAYNVKQSYFSALSAKISRDIYDQSVKQLGQHLKQAKAFYEVGTKSKIDVTNAEVNLSNAKLNRIKASNLYKTAISNLNNAMGIPDAPEYEIADTITFKRPGPQNKKEVNVSQLNQADAKNSKNESVLKSTVIKYDLIENLSFKKYDISFENAIKNAFEQRPDLKALITKEGAAGESVKLAKKDYYPVLSGFANYGLGGQQFPLDNGWAFGANVTVPVFNGLLTKNQIKEAQANLAVARSNIDILKQNIFLQVQQAYINLTESEKQIPITEMIVRQAKENLDLANGRYNVGVGNSIEVQDAEINYNNAQLAYVQAFYDYNIARINLEKAMGVK